jgi:hypothetical protein
MQQPIPSASKLASDLAADPQHWHGETEHMTLLIGTISDKHAVITADGNDSWLRYERRADWTF